MKAAASTGAFRADHAGWQAERTGSLRPAIHAVAAFDETIEWGNLVFLHLGPCILTRAKTERALLGFWRGQRLRDAEPRIKVSGKYELGNIELRAGDSIDTAHITAFARQAAALNARFGDPTKPTFE